MPLPGVHTAQFPLCGSLAKPPLQRSVHILEAFPNLGCSTKMPFGSLGAASHIAAGQTQADGALGQDEKLLLKEKDKATDSNSTLSSRVVRQGLDLEHVHAAGFVVEPVTVGLGVVVVVLTWS